jgi:dTDP-4-dehydrorhamnose 3,5-epimerase
MNTATTDIEGLLIIEPSVFTDARGYFSETYHNERYKLPGSFPFVQDNEAKSSKGVLRGLHFQKGDNAQGKLVRAVIGSVYDVAVDLREGSVTYGKSFGIILSDENKKQLWVPRGFAHGYLVLEDDTIFTYKCDNYYHKPSEGGLMYNDPELNISWPSMEKSFIVSEKDLHLPSLENLQS